MFFSIIVPVYNCEKYLEQCIESVLEQKFSDYELILVDDGSTDSSGDICDKYSNKYCQVSVIHQINKGLFEARKSGVLLARGEYILSLDADDWFDENAFLSIYNILSKNTYDVLIFDFQRCHKNNRIQNNGNLLVLDKKYTRNEIINEAIFYEKINNLCNKVIKTTIYKSACKNLSMRMINGEDLFVTLRVFNLSSKFFYLNKTLYNYRYNEYGSTMKIRDTYFDDIEMLYKEKLKFLGDVDISKIRYISNFTMNRVLKVLILFTRQNNSLKIKKAIYKSVISKAYFLDSIKYKSEFHNFWFIEFLILKKQKFYILDKYLKLLYFLQQVKKFCKMY